MIHKPIHIKNLSLCFPHKTCFEDFSTQIHYGTRIAIVGRNGSGKSSLLKLLRDTMPDDVKIGYVPQVIESFTDLSGGQRFNQALTQALADNPNVLLLDEPTNHLDRSNRRSLLRMLKSFPGTLIVVSHDVELLRSCVTHVWHMDQGAIRQFSGAYEDYMREVHLQHSAIEQELSLLDRQKKDMHQALMSEQKRAAKSKDKGQRSIDRSKWPTIVSHAKAGRAQETSGRKTTAIDEKKQSIIERLGSLRVPETIVPKFSITAEAVGDGVVVSIHAGTVGYAQLSQKRETPQAHILKDIYLSVTAKERIAIVGDNGSGKTTLIKALLGDPNVIRQGDWHAPQDIGYLDQHYATLDPALSVIEVIKRCADGSVADIRRHLNDFLFRKNEEVETLVANLSGGEKARLSLAKIAAKTPKLLVLDEMTNNLDLETRAHVIQVLRHYPGAIIAISHDENFLKEIGIEHVYEVKSQTLCGCHDFNLR